MNSHQEIPPQIPPSRNPIAMGVFKGLCIFFGLLAAAGISAAAIVYAIYAAFYCFGKP